MLTRLIVAIPKSIKNLLLAAIVTATVALIWHMTPMSRWNYTMLKRENWWVKFYIYYYVYLCLSLAVFPGFIVGKNIKNLLVPALVLSVALYSFSMFSLMFGEGILAQHFTLWYIYNGVVVYSYYSLFQMMFIPCLVTFLMLRLISKQCRLGGNIFSELCFRRCGAIFLFDENRWYMSYQSCLDPCRTSRPG